MKPYLKTQTEIDDKKLTISIQPKKNSQNFDSFDLNWKYKGDSGTLEIKSSHIQFKNKSEKKDFFRLHLKVRTKIFEQVIKNVHAIGVGDDSNFTTAAIIIDDNKDIYLDSNIEVSHPYHKNCSERNVLETIGNHRGSSFQSIKELHVIGGFKDSEETPKEISHIFCCGLCIDALKKFIEDKTIFVFYPKATIRGQETEIIDNRGQKNQKQNLEKNSILICDSGALYPQKDIILTETAITAYRSAYDKLINNELSNIEFTSFEIFDGKQRELTREEINKMLTEILIDTYNSREKTTDSEQNFKNISKIKASIIRLNDGSYACGIEPIGPSDKSSPTNSSAAIVQAHVTMKQKKVTDVWVMELNPEQLIDKKIEISFEDLERPLKLASKKRVKDYSGEDIQNDCNYTITPFNSGDLNKQQIDEISTTFKATEMYKSNFTGVTKSSSGNYLN